MQAKTAETGGVLFDYWTILRFGGGVFLHKTLTNLRTGPLFSTTDHLKAAEIQGCSPCVSRRNMYDITQHEALGKQTDALFVYMIQLVIETPSLLRG